MAPQSWFNIPKQSQFSLANIPFGIISTASAPTPRPATVIGDYALDLHTFALNDGFKKLPVENNLSEVFAATALNRFAALGRQKHSMVRRYIIDIFRDNTPYPEILQENEDLKSKVLVPLSQVKNHVPLEIGDYTDFFAGINHAFTVGTFFRGPENALQPNYKHLPVGYHGRASSVIVSGTPIRRPWGQQLIDPSASPKVPTFAPCRRLDIELELGAFICQPNELGEPVHVDKAEESIFGYVLVNDWSARDIQTWEYVPLGPFNAKNFATTISPWVVLPDALAPFSCRGIENDTPLQPYLRESRDKNQYDISLEVELRTRQGDKTIVTKTSSKNLIWSFAQMIAHHTVSGCNLRPGDLLGSGTISGLGDSERGSLLEQNKAGKQTIMLNGGHERKFLADGDTITIRGVCGSGGDAIVGFGDCRGQILEATDLFKTDEI